MPGRAKTRLRRVERLELSSLLLRAQIQRAAQKYAGAARDGCADPEKVDPLHFAWFTCDRLAGQLAVELEQLGGLVRAKADEPRPSPGRIFRQLAKQAGMEQAMAAAARELQQLTGRPDVLLDGCMGDEVRSGIKDSADSRVS